MEKPETDRKQIEPQNIPRINRLIRNAINKFKLSLENLVVLTEAGSQYYMLTPLIAALSGAERVYAVAGDSVYGRAEDIGDATMALGRNFGVNEKIQILYSRHSPEVSTADIITNLGHVRPLDEDLVRALKNTAAVPLMFEAWEFREEDLDLSKLRTRGIPVTATNEDHPYLQTMRYVGQLAVKLLHGMDIEIVRSVVVVFGSGKFGLSISQALHNAGAKVKVLEGISRETLLMENHSKIFQGCDALVIAEHVSSERLIGPGGAVTARELCKLNPGLVIAHIAGNVDQSEIIKSNLGYLPCRFGQPGHMSVSTSYLGPRPLIDLHTAGLKIGEVMARARIEGLDRAEAEKKALKLKFAEALL